MALSLKNIPRGPVIVGVCVLGAVLAALAGYGLLGGRTKAPSSSAKSLTPRNIESTVGGTGSANYNQMLEEHNRQEARKAADRGLSHVSTIVGDDRRDVAEEKPPVVEEKPKAAPQPTAPRRQPQPAKKEDENKAMLADLRGMMNKKSNGRDNLPVTAYYPEGQAAQASGIQGDGTAKAPVAASPADAGGAFAALGSSLKVGDMLYAVNTVAINSDIPSPIVVKVVQGRFRGSKIIGGFQRHQESLLISFNQLITASGEALAIEAVAIDPQTSSAAIADEVDTHFFSRWGSLVAASFIEGFGSAMTNRNTRVQSNGDIMMQETNKSYGDVALEAMGKVGQRAATQVERNFDRPPTVYVKVGEPFGVLIMGIGKQNGL